MTNAEIALRGQKNTAEIAAKDRAYKKYDTDTRASTADKDRSQKERSDSRSASLTRRGQNLKLVTDLTGTVAKAAPAAIAALNDPEWWTQGFSQEEIAHIVPTNWKVDAYAPINPGYGPDESTGVVRDACFCAKNTIPNWNTDPDSTDGYPSITDPINRAFQMLKTQLQRKAGYNLGFQSSDVALMILACREIVSLSHFIGKVFRYAIKGTAYNAAYPAAIFDLLHIHYQDLVQNYNTYRGRFEALLPLMDVLPTPDLPLFHRAAQLFGSTWMDDQYPDKQYQYKATRYHVRPLGFNILSAISADSPSKLEFIDMAHNGASSTLGEYLDLLELAIKRILTRDDFVEIAGRLADLYPKSWSYRDIDTDTPQIAVFEPMTVAQIHNAVCPYINTSHRANLDIVTKENGLIYQEVGVDLEAKTNVSPETTSVSFPVTVDLPSDMPVTTGAVIDATRLKIGIKHGGMGGWKDESTALKYQNCFLMVAWDFICNLEILMKDNDRLSNSFEVLGGSVEANQLLAHKYSDAINLPLVPIVRGDACMDLARPWIIDNPVNLPMTSFEAMNRMAALSAVGVTGFFDH